MHGNVAFHASPDAAEAAGFRACKRCKPRDWRADLGLSRPVARACALFDQADGETPPSLAEVARQVGLSSGALGKRFIAELGVNPRDWLVARKRQRFRKALREGEVIARFYLDLYARACGHAWTFACQRLASAP